MRERRILLEAHPLADKCRGNRVASFRKTLSEFTASAGYITARGSIRKARVSHSRSFHRAHSRIYTHTYILAAGQPRHESAPVYTKIWGTGDAVVYLRLRARMCVPKIFIRDVRKLFASVKNAILLL